MSFSAKMNPKNTIRRFFRPPHFTGDRPGRPVPGRLDTAKRRCSRYLPFKRTRSAFEGTRTNLFQKQSVTSKIDET